jgi:hypothetical protein
MMLIICFNSPNLLNIALKKKIEGKHKNQGKIKVGGRNLPITRTRPHGMFYDMKMQHKTARSIFPYGPTFFMLHSLEEERPVIRRFGPSHGLFKF